MGRIAQIVIGPAGSGKSTYCHAMQRHFQASKRPLTIVNLDPAAEKFHYQPAVDIGNLIRLEDVMNELSLGPNGGLMFCMEYLLDNIEWLDEEIGTENEDEYLIIDCPGQIELFTHSDIMKRILSHLETRLQLRLCVVYLLETQFIADPTKFFSGVLTAISAMIQLETAHINILSKMDLVEGKPSENAAKLSAESAAVTHTSTRKQTAMEAIMMGAEDPNEPQESLANTWTEEELEERERRRDMINLERYLDPNPALLLDNVKTTIGGDKWQGLNCAIARLIEDYDMVSFMPLNIHDEESMEAILYSIDLATQFDEDREPKEQKEWETAYEDDHDLNEQMMSDLCESR